MFVAVHRTKPRVELEKSKVIVFGEHILVVFRVLTCVCLRVCLLPFWPSACLCLFAATSGLNLMIHSMLAHRNAKSLKTHRNKRQLQRLRSV